MGMITSWVFRLTLKDWLQWTGKSYHTIMRTIGKHPKFPKSRFEKDKQWFVWLNEKEYKQYSKDYKTDIVKIKPKVTVEHSKVEIPKTKEDAKDKVLRTYWEVVDDTEASSELKMKAAERIVKAMALDKVDSTKEELEDKFLRLSKELKVQKIDYNRMKEQA